MEGAIVHSIKHCRRHNVPEGSMFLAKEPPKRDTNMLQQANSKFDKQHWQSVTFLVSKQVSKPKCQSQECDIFGFDTGFETKMSFSASSP